MCGIIGYVGNSSDSVDGFLAEALTRLEYRGYDSYGVVTLQEGRPTVLRGTGAASEALEEDPALFDMDGSIGLGHTRWATHGKVCVENAHPIAGTPPPPFPGAEVPRRPTCWVVHNGVVTNYASLRAELQAQGVRFQTETDTECIAHLFAREAELIQETELSGLSRSMTATVARLEGRSSFAVVSSRWPDKLACATTGPPLLVTKTGYLASDPAALSGHCELVYRMQDGQMAVLWDRGLWVFTAESNNELEKCNVSLVRILDPVEVGQGSFPHHMLKEIHEQVDVARPRLYKHLPGFLARRTILFGCGSSYNAALVGRHYYERLTENPAQAEYAAEMPTLLAAEDEDVFYLALTQSGETRDTLDALQGLGLRPCSTAAVLTNNVHSEAGRLATPIGLDCGPEYGVAATKTFLAQAVHLYSLAWQNGCKGTGLFDNMSQLSAAIKSVLADSEQIQSLAAYVAQWHNILYLGRGLNYAIAREGALKMKEVAYKHAEAMPASEMKHGPIALIDDRTLSIFLLTHGDPLLSRVLSNIEEIRARGGAIVVVADEEVAALVPPISRERFHVVPKVQCPLLQPLAVNVVLQLLAYYVAVGAGLNVDRPRNLAKSVTVE